MKNSLEIKLKLPEKISQSCYRSIKIESKNYSSKRSMVKINYHKKEQLLEIKIKAKDLSALRATMNTYLRWIIICQELLKN